MINACVAAAIERDRAPSIPSGIQCSQVEDAAEDSTILAASEVKKSTSTDITPESPSMGVEEYVEKPFVGSADCRIPAASSTADAEDTGEVKRSSADSTIVAASEVAELPRTTFTDVAPEAVDGDVEKTSADCRIPAASSTADAEDMGDFLFFPEDSTIVAGSEVEELPTIISPHDVTPKEVEGDDKKPSAASADCRIATSSSSDHVEGSGEVRVSLADSTILAASDFDDFLCSAFTDDVMPEEVEGHDKNAFADCCISPTAGSFTYAHSIKFFSDEFLNAPCPSVLYPIVSDDGNVVVFGCLVLPNHCILNIDIHFFLCFIMSQYTEQITPSPRTHASSLKICYVLLRINRTC